MTNWHKLLRAWTASVLTLAVLPMVVACQRSSIERIDIGADDRRMKLNIQEAIAKYEQRRRLEPTDHQNLWRLAAAREKLEQWEAVVALMAEASELAPEFANYWYQWGYALVQVESYREARALLSTCVQKDPNFARCHYYLALSNERLGEPARALHHYFDTLRVDPRYAAAYAFAAELCFAYGRLNTATALVKASDPHMDTADEQSRRLLHSLAAKLAVARGDWRTAVEKLEALHARTGIEDLYLLALAHARQEPPELEQAEQVLSGLRQKHCLLGDDATLPAECAAVSALALEVRSRQSAGQASKPAALDQN